MKGICLTTLGVLILSFDGLLIRLISAGSFDLLFWRGLLMSLMVLAILRLRKTNTSWLPRDATALRSSVFLCISTITFVVAISLSSVVNVLVIISSQPLFAAVLGWIVLKEMPAPATWVAIVICIFGVGWVLAGSWSTPSLVGDLMALICCLSLAAKFVNDRAVSHRDMTPSLILAGLVVALVSWVMGDPMALSGSQWGYMITLCLFVYPIAFFLITLGPCAFLLLKWAC